MKILTLKKLIEMESERCITIATFKDCVLELLDLFEKDNDSVPVYPNASPITYPQIQPYSIGVPNGTNPIINPNPFVYIGAPNQPVFHNISGGVASCYPEGTTITNTKTD